MNFSSVSYIRTI